METNTASIVFLVKIMKKKVVFLYFFSIISVLCFIGITGCEKDPNIPSYIYTQDNNGEINEDYYFIPVSQKELFEITSAYPLEATERANIGSPLGACVLTDSQKATYKHLMDDFILNFYNLSYLNLSQGVFENCGTLFYSQTKTAIEQNQYYERLFSEIKDSKIIFAVEEFRIFDYVTSYRTGDGNIIYRLPCYIRIDFSGKDKEGFNEIYNNYVSGNTNEIELWMYFIETPDGLQIYAWQESFKNPFSVTWFTHGGIKEVISDQPDIISECNYYEDFFNGYIVEEIQENNLLTESAIQFLSSLFDRSSQDSEFYYTLQKNNIDVIADSIKTSYRRTLTCSKGQETFYCVDLNLNYETYSQNISLLNYKEIWLPTGAFSTVASIMMDNNGNIICWNLSDFKRVNYTHSQSGEQAQYI